MPARVLDKVTGEADDLLRRRLSEGGLEVPHSPDHAEPFALKTLIIAVAATITLSACAEPSERLDHQQLKVARCMDTGTKSLTECRAWAAAN
jgi:hypothetical protein